MSLNGSYPPRGVQPVLVIRWKICCHGSFGKGDATQAQRQLLENDKNWALMEMGESEARP
ncbi:MAG: hypothetical protein DWI22_11710 [Planctomycetota bacterium]|nr:MAG: hypothetical protein DWI22_11710 [Planctomycetota bacterium]